MNYNGIYNIGIINWIMLKIVGVFGLFTDMARTLGDNYVCICPQCNRERVFKKTKTGWKEIRPTLQERL